MDPSIAEVASLLCKGCGQCVQACPYGAVDLVDLKSGMGLNIAQINGYLCKGCGTCAAACPNKAMSLIHYTDRQIINEMIGALA